MTIEKYVTSMPFATERKSQSVNVKIPGLEMV